MTSDAPPSAPLRYDPIAEYGAIGNMQGVALVSARGSIDWCCLPDLDGPSVFAAILDARIGGRFRIGPPGAPRGRQRYIERTNVLVTEFDHSGGCVAVTDFMPLDGDIGMPSNREVDPAIVRLIECRGADAELEIEWSSRFDYARDVPRITRENGAFVAIGAHGAMALTGLPSDCDARIEDEGATLRARVPLRAGQRLALVARCGRTARRDTAEDLGQALQNTVRSWARWLEGWSPRRTKLDAAWHRRVERSGLVLKLLTHRHTGAIAAAPTTSLPEQIGGVRNWDYRYTWIRDAAFTAQALTALGHVQEAGAFLRWLQHLTKSDDPSAFDLQIMYGLHGETKLPEFQLDHLEGYCGSRPVRVGNAAAAQRQLDVYGELLDAAWEMVRLGERVDAELWRFLTEVANRVCERWREPDHGIWEIRDTPRQYVHSKVMAWVTLDRALRMAERFDLTARDAARWTRERDAIREAVLTKGYDAHLGAFVQSFGSHCLDASNLLIPIVEFLPCDDPRVQGTIDQTMKRLMHNGVVCRYSADDGLPGGEGAFGLTTFWLIDALALSGRVREARALFEGMARRASPLGLYSEEFDPDTGALLGNFPQAFTHIGFINSALYLAKAEGAAEHVPAPTGTREHRESAA